jgi:hypothetical protein
MPDREKVKNALEAHSNTVCISKNGEDCPYFSLECRECSRILAAEALALLKEQELEIKGLRKLVEWAVECDFGYDNLGDWWVDRFKSEIEDMSYTEGLIHLAKRYVEVFDGGDGDG